MGVKGYKVFNEDWTCRDKEYHCPGIFKEDIDKDNLKVCKNGMHFCKNVVDCFSYYMFDTRNHVCEVEALGDIDEGVDKCCTNKLKVIREIPWEEVFTIVNTGCRNTGIGNSGHNNTGHYNSGDYNTGKQNTGNYNKGNNNTGMGNTGDYNTDDFNIGNFNSGRRNYGYNNSGDFNIGNNNTGDYNNGHFNTGGSNTGDYNTGKYNIGNFNSGDFNKADRCSGVFCTKTDKIMMFNKPTDWTYEDWKNSLAYKIILYSMPEEKNIYGIGRQDWWDSLIGIKQNSILELPNFDKDIFKEITGIDVGDCENFRKRSENHGKKL